MKYILVACISLFYFDLNAQTTGDFSVMSGLDILKTDIEGALSKMQLNAEVGYYINADIMGSIGMEIWTQEKTSLVIGVQWFPHDRFFLQARGLIGVNRLSIGGGYSWFITDSLRLSAEVALYDNGPVGFRFGSKWIIRREHSLKL